MDGLLLSNEKPPIDLMDGVGPLKSRGTYESVRTRARGEGGGGAKFHEICLPFYFFSQQLTHASTIRFSHHGDLGVSIMYKPPRPPICIQ